MQTKIKALLAVAIIAAGIGGATLLRAESDYDFTLVNGTGYEIDEVYVAPSKSTDWGNDIMGQGTLAIGAAVHIVFHPKAQAKKWDLMIKWTAPGYPNEIWTNLDLAAINKITLKYDRAKDVTSAIVE